MKRLKIKIKCNSGSAMLLTIFALTLVTMLIIMFSSAIGNQMKSTMRADENLKKKYQAEGYIEEALGEFIESINVKAVTNSKNEMIGYKVDYKESDQDMSVVTRFNNGGSLPEEMGLSVKPNTEIDFEITIKRENDELDNDKVKYKYIDKYKIESIIIVKIRDLNSIDKYNISYEISKWEKVND